MPYAPDLSGLALEDRYELHAVIGEGTFGRVYRGRDRRLARAVAIKVIKPWWAEDPEWVRSFEQEAQLLARVNDPGIVQIFDVGHAVEGLYYVAELVEGESLADRLRRGPLDAEEARGIAEQLTRALARAHAQRVIHRDIKPANVLLSTRGEVKLGDFGVARLAEGSTDGASATVVGTPRYMAPEQAQGGPTGPATDIYGVGIVLYEMLAGRPPFREASAVELALRHLNDPPPPLPDGTPPVLARIVARALAKRPEDRWPSAVALVEALAGARERGLREAGRMSPGQMSPERMTAGVMTTAPRTPGQTSSAPTTPPPLRPGARPGVEPPRTAPPLGPAATAATATADGQGTTAILDPARPPDSARPHLPAATQVRHPTLPRPAWGPRAASGPRAATRPQPGHRAPRRPRRAYLAALAAILLAALAATAVVLLTASTTVRIPSVRGLRRSAATTRLHHLGLKSRFAHRHSRVKSGEAISQAPRAGARVDRGTTVRVVLSDGPPPVPVPPLVGKTGSEAQTLLGDVGLRATLTPVPAPGVSPGVVTNSSPVAGADIAPGSTVALSVAEQPQWRPLTSFSGTAGGHSVAFRILGTQWRVVYNMNYQGLCTFIFFCSGPSARVFRPAGNVTVTGFGLSSGNGQTRVFSTGPGVYEISVTPGADTASWSLAVQDYY